MASYQIDSGWVTELLGLLGVLERVFGFSARGLIHISPTRSTRRRGRRFHATEGIKNYDINNYSLYTTQGINNYDIYTTEGKNHDSSN